MEVLSRTKADERARSIPGVMPTLSKESRNVVESYQLEVNSFIGKPVAFEEIAKIVTGL
jgi:DNA-binding NarL/FixJ family response regulator